MKTKQEQIEEMKTLLLETYVEWLDKPATDKKPNLYDMDANKLYNAGYRKAEEIRKETAKEILNELIDSSNKITFFDCRMALGLDKLAKQYGVEVEE